MKSSVSPSEDASILRYSGGVAQDCTGIPGLLMMTAANPYETSKANAFDNELQVYLSNTFTSSILSQLESHPQTVSATYICMPLTRQTDRM